MTQPISDDALHLLSRFQKSEIHFDKVAKRVPAFKGILNEWDSLVALLKSEMEIHGKQSTRDLQKN